MHAEITRKFIYGMPSPDGDLMTYAYYNNNDTIAVELFNNNGYTVKIDGIIPDTTVHQYNSDGTKVEINIKDNKRNGTTKGYYQNGDLRSEVNFENGSCVGMGYTYYENGKIWLETNYNSELRTYIEKLYDMVGHLLRSISYKDGRRDGQVIDYNYDGSIDKIENYKNGKLHGDVMHYSQGKISAIEQFQDGKKSIGNDRYLKVISSSISIKHQPVEEYIIIDKYEDESKFEWHFIDGKRNGISKEYYPGETKFKSQEPLFYGIKGLEMPRNPIEQYVEGSTRAEWNYKNDILDGISRIYDSNSYC